MKKLLLILTFLLAAPFAAHAAYDKDYVGEMSVHKAAHEDVFADLARKHGLGYVEMRAANPGIDPWLPGAGTEILIPDMHLLPEAPREGIVINLPEMRLYYFPENGGVPEVYSIGIGREGLDTPLGATKVTRKKVGPTWRPTQRMREEDPELPESVPPGPENPLGTHAIYLGWPAYLIHGTHRPYGIGRRVSSGCIRLYPEGIIELYDKVEVGDKVTVVDQPIKVGWKEDALYLEAHPSTQQADQVEVEGEPTNFRLSEEEMHRILEAAGPYTEELDWPEIRRAIRERRGYPVVIATRPDKEASLN